MRHAGRRPGLEATAISTPIRRHYALVPEKVKGGWRVDYVQEFRSRGEAERASLTLLGRHGAGEAVTTIDRQLADGDVIDDATLKGSRGS